MSLYDDEDIEAAAPSDVTLGWSRGVQLMQSQMQLKKASSKTPSLMTPPAINKNPVQTPPQRSPFNPITVGPTPMSVVNKNRTPDQPKTVRSEKKKKPVSPSRWFYAFSSLHVLQFSATAGDDQ